MIYMVVARYKVGEVIAKHRRGQNAVMETKMRRRGMYCPQGGMMTFT